MGPEVTDYIDSQVFEATYHEVPAHTTRKEPIVISVSAAENDAPIPALWYVVRKQPLSLSHAPAKEHRTAADNTGAKANAEADAPATSRTRAYRCRETRTHTSCEMLGVDDDQQHLESVGIEAHEDAVCDVRQYALGGGAVGMGLAVNLVGNRARLDLNNRYHACHEELLDINHVARMRGCATRRNCRIGNSERFCA